MVYTVHSWVTNVFPEIFALLPAVSEVLACEKNTSKRMAGYRKCLKYYLCRMIRSSVRIIDEAV